MKDALISVGSFLMNLVHGTSNGTVSGRPVSMSDTDSSQDIVLVIDVSPSMKHRDWPPSRLAGAKRATKAFVERLLEADPNARVAVVAYASRAHVAVKLQSIRNCAEITRRIDRISTGSGTNITAGLEAAIGLFRRGGPEQHVILLTDGQHNCGPGPEGVARRLRQSTIVECIGMAGTPETVDTRLPELASEDEYGRKRYRWIGEPEQLVKTFEQLATGLTRQR